MTEKKIEEVITLCDRRYSCSREIKNIENAEGVFAGHYDLATMTSKAYFEGYMECVAENIRDNKELYKRLVECAQQWVAECLESKKENLKDIQKELDSM